MAERQAAWPLHGDVSAPLGGNEAVRAAAGAFRHADAGCRSCAYLCSCAAAVVEFSNEHGWARQKTCGGEWVTYG